MDKCRNCGCESLIWTEKRDYYLCPKCQKSFSVDEETGKVEFSPDLINALASQVAGQITPLIDKAIDKKLKPAPKKEPPQDDTGPGKVSDGPVSKKEEETKHKWDQ